MTAREKPRTVPKAKEGRTLRFDRSTGTLVITMPIRGKVTETAYRVAEYEADFGRAFAVVKLDGAGDEVERYDVNTDGHCSCIDHEKHQHDCKHICAIRHLVNTGTIGGGS